MTATDMRDRKAHWDQVHGERDPDRVTWYQPFPRLSMELIDALRLPCAARVIDVGGGVSPLVDVLLERGFEEVTVLDISATALGHARARLGSRAEGAKWVVCDVLEDVPPGHFDLWHDRAVFHFLTEAPERERYAQRLRSCVHPGGHAIISTFAHDGPERCSGLEVVRYTPDALHRAIGPGWSLLETRYEVHQTPASREQRFVYCVFRRVPHG